MKPTDILVVTTHSFVDLITNSSSELFVSNGKKTVDAIKELLAALLKNHNALMGTNHEFKGVFGKIEIPKYTFDFWNVPEAIKTEYNKYKEYGCPFYRRASFSSSEDRTAELDTLMEMDQEISRKHNAYEKGISEKASKKRYEAYQKEVDALWTDYAILTFRSEMALFREFLKQNNFDEATLLKFDRKVESEAKKHLKAKGGKYFYPRFSGKIRTAWDTFSMWEGYGIQVKKDSIIIHSANDNSIPYEMMETISAYLGADRYHIG